MRLDKKNTSQHLQRNLLEYCYKLLNIIVTEILDRINVKEQIREVEEEEVIVRGNNIKFTKTINYIRESKENEKERTRKRVVEKRI